jgi:sporulation protein YlmC with PRC-barrel domain
LKNCNIEDKNGVQIGRLLDAVFRLDKSGFTLTKFTVGGSRLEEILEDLGLKEDVDPVFPVEVISGVSPKRIRLNVAKNELKQTSLHKDAIAKDEIKLSEISKFKVLDTDSQHIGNIIDLKFTGKVANFIIGDGFMLELLEDAGLRADVDLLLAPEFIQQVEDNQIKLSRSKVELEEIFDKHLPGFKRIDVDTQTDMAGGPQRKTIYFPRSQI